MIKSLIYFFLLCSLLITGCATKISETMKMTDKKLQRIKFLNNEELKILFSENTLKGIRLYDNLMFTLKYYKNGTFLVSYTNSNKISLGKWIIINNEKCDTFSNGEIKCRSFYKDGNKIFSYNKKRKLITSYIKI